jgi:tubulin monoglycylase TTLL15
MRFNVKIYSQDTSSNSETSETKEIIRENVKRKVHFDDEIVSENSFFDLRTKRGQILFIFVTILIALLVPQLPVQKIRDFLAVEYTPKCGTPTQCPEVEMPLKPTYWIYGSGGEGQWIHVKNVLHRLGFERVSENESDIADLLWAHDYPFTKLREKMMSLKPHQKVNQ